MTFSESQEVRGAEGQIAPDFQQTEGQVLGGAQAIGKHLTEQTALLQELKDQVGQL